jgi:hypothetical protein
MASAWHYMKDGKQCGPVSSAELKKLASSGELQSTDVLWKEGMADWVPACELSGLKGVFPEPAFVPASPPPPPPSSSSSSMAPPPPTAQNTQVRLFSKKQKRRRILLIVASGIVVTCFLLPLFYVSVGSKSSLCFGWNLWFGIICFIIGLLSLASSIVDLVLQRILLIRNILKWVHLGTYSVITLCAFLGTILGIFGVGMKIYVSGGFNSRGRWMSLSDLPDMVSKGCIPIMSLILIGAGVLGLVTAIKIVRGDKA